MSADLAALPWERWADGRPWRLKDGKHFPGDPEEAIAAAERAAERMGKVVRTLADIQQPHTYVWVQFADHQLAPGTPCPCGERRLLRVHPDFARCPSCGRTALLVDKPRAARPENPLTSLDAYSDVTIFEMRRSRDGRKESAFGHALDPRERRMLIVVSFPLRGGERIPDPAKPGRDPDDLAGYTHAVRWWDVGPFAEGIDLEALGGRRLEEPRP